MRSFHLYQTGRCRSGGRDPASGIAFLDQSALTGELIPVQRNGGEQIMSGVTNVGEAFDLLASRRAAESTYAGIVRLVEAAQRSKAPMSRLADRFAMVFLGVTVVMAGGAWFWTGNPIRGVAVLVVATPCPLILAVPVAIVSGLSRAARHGVLIKGGKALEMMARIRTLVIDKTGTLTDGRARIVRIDAAPGQSPEEVLQAAASLDQASKHVIAQTIVFEAHDRRLRLAVPTNVIETAGEGIEGRVEGRNVVLGGVRYVTSKLPRAGGRSIGRPTQPGAAIVAVAIDGKLAAHLVLADELRPGVIEILRSLRRLNVERIVLAQETGERWQMPSLLIFHSMPCGRISHRIRRSWSSFRSVSAVSAFETARGFHVGRISGSS